MPASKPPIPSVWARQRRQREQPALTQVRIVAEAVKLLDEEGLEALSMRTLGTRLGAGATSLYRHVASKDELLELVVDEVYGELNVPEAGEEESWRTPLEASARNLRAMILRHPWVASVLGQTGLVQLGPNLIHQSERMLTLYQRAGFGAGEADQAMNTLIAYVIGIASSEAAYLSMLARSGMSEQEFVDSLRPTVDAAVEEHPLLKDGYSARADDAPLDRRDQDFTYGLDRVLDGFEARLSKLR